MKLKTGFRDSREARSFAQANAEPEDLFQGVEPETLPKMTGQFAPEFRMRHTRGMVLREAISTVNGERQDVYGKPEDSFALISDYWTTYLRSKCTAVANAGFCVEADDVAMMMTLFKIAREANQHKRDNIVDAAGYLGIYADMQGTK